MPEKSKWFDSQQKRSAPAAPPAMYASASVAKADADRLLKDLTTLREAGDRLPADTFKLFQQLCQMPPAARLSRNLKLVLSVLAKQAITDIMQEGLTEVERLALLDLEHLGAPSDLRAVAQGLLNINERAQLVAMTQEMYREERARRWKGDDV